MTNIEEVQGPILRHATMSNHQRLREFLSRCNKRGKTYRWGMEWFPDLMELAQICQCSESTISRIATGKQQAIKASISDILLAVGCISPYAAYEKWSEYDSELQSRFADARDRIEAGPATQVDVLDAILAGIHRRIYE